MGMGDVDVRDAVDRVVRDCNFNGVTPET